MPIYNKCSRCAHPIKARTPPHPVLAERLRHTRHAICSDCDPRSAWHRIAKKASHHD